MDVYDIRTSLCAVALSFVVALGTPLQGSAAAADSMEFEPEQVGLVSALPDRFPEHWMLVRDFGALAMSLEGRILLIDPLGETLSEQFKGLLTASFTAGFQHGHVRNEFYVIETFWSRGGRGGERTDLVSIWDPQALTVVAEIPIPAGRLTGLPKPLATALLGNDERYLAIYNFSPAQSVAIVDLERRAFVGEVAIGGCGLVLANGHRSFTSFCGNGTLKTTHLKEDGTLDSATSTPEFFDAQTNPLFDMASVWDGTAYLATFGGDIIPVDVSGERLSVGKRWRLTEVSEDPEDAQWRPGGMSLLVHDAQGLAYVLMHPEGKEGTHDNGGSEVWVYDFKERKRLSRIKLENWGISIGTSGTGEQRYLFVTNADRDIDLYHIPDGRYVKKLDVGAFGPFHYHGLQR